MNDVSAGGKTAEERFTVLFSEHQDQVARVVRRKLRRDDGRMVEDLVQETFLRLWVYMAPGRTVDHPAALLATMARRAVADHYRRFCRGSLERPADFSDPVQSRRLPAAVSAEDSALDRLFALAVADVLDVPVADETRLAVAA